MLDKHLKNEIVSPYKMVIGKVQRLLKSNSHIDTASVNIFSIFLFLIRTSIYIPVFSGKQEHFGTNLQHYPNQ